MISTRWLGLFACLAALPGPCAAALVPLNPANTRIGLTVYAFGLVPQSGHFTRFKGRLQFDPAHPSDCRVQVIVESASLDMGVALRSALAVGPSLLDAAHYPEFRYIGACSPTRTTGQLTLHGETQTLVLTEKFVASRVTATGTLHRQDYGIDGLPALIGATIGIVFTVDLPPDLAERLH